MVLITVLISIVVRWAVIAGVWWMLAYKYRLETPGWWEPLVLVLAVQLFNIKGRIRYVSPDKW